VRDLTAERIAARFHETYERRAPEFGYETRAASAVPWMDVPENNRRLMTAVCGEVVAAVLRQVADECDTIREGAEIGEFYPAPTTWLRHRADQIEAGQPAEVPDAR
jgi:hypothetical protein